MHKVYYHYHSQGQKYVTVIATADEELDANKLKEEFYIK